MIKLRPAYILLSALFAFLSCSTEEMADKGVVGRDNQITFHSEISGTRGEELTTSNFYKFMVTAFNPSDKSLAAADGTLLPYFENELFEQIEGTNNFANLTHPEYCWPVNDEPLSFVAYSHSPHEMRQRCELTSDDFFELQNNSRASGTVSLGYRLAKFQVPADISRQFDFVTAHAKSKKSDTAVPLNFKHQLSQIVVKVCGLNPGYSINIAGVCIGQPVEEGTLDFSPSDGNAAWIFPEHTSKGRVSYIYQTGDEIKTLEANKTVSEAEAFSIMGNGGPAMVIPTRNKKWHGKEDPGLEIEDETMYLSVLMRVVDTDNEVMFPFSDEDGLFTVVHLAVDNSGKVVSPQLYYDKETGKYYTDQSMKTPYNIPSGISISHFSWAAVPVDASWLPGKRYVYTLDYSSGIGIQDPVDPDPGKPIVSSDVVFTVGLSEWGENSNIDVDVPGTGEKDKDTNNGDKK